MVTGNTYLFRLTATKHGTVWDITGATVKLGLSTPAGVVSVKTATITNAAGGVAEYTSVAGDINTAGIWVRSWEITQGAIVQESAPSSFIVIPGLI